MLLAQTGPKSVLAVIQVLPSIEARAASLNRRSSAASSLLDRVDEDGSQPVCSCRV
jgi:hypothetical protein